MFLASMSASVFFSFDSHFNAIFPADQKKRAAEIRTLNQVGRVVADIGEEAQARAARGGRAAVRGRRLEGLRRAARQAGARGEGRAGRDREVLRREDGGAPARHRRAAGAHRRRRARPVGAAAQARRGGGRAAAHRAGDRRARGRAGEGASRPTTRPGRRIAAKRIDASAEDGGVEGTLKRGKGPVWRQRLAELEELQRKLAITDEPRLKEAQKQRDRVSARIVGLKREIATINGEVAKYKGETQTAEQRIKSVAAADADGEGGKVDPGARPAGLRAGTHRLPPAARRGEARRRAGAVQQPARRHAGHAGRQGARAQHRLRSQAGGRRGGAPVRPQCGLVALPGQVRRRRQAAAERHHRRAAGLRAPVPAGLRARRQAGGGDRRAPAGHRHEPGRQGAPLRRDLERLPRRQPPGLPGAGAGDRRRRAGVHGRPVRRGSRQVAAVGRAEPEGAQRRAAGGRRSTPPCCRIAYENARAGAQCDAADDAAATATPSVSSFTRTTRSASISAPGAERGIDDRRACATSTSERYELRSELFEYLSRVAKKAFSDRQHVVSAELERIVSVALLPDVKENAETVLQYVHPIEGKPNFMAKMDLKRRRHELQRGNPAQRGDRAATRRSCAMPLNAGATMEAVQRDDNSHYFVSSRVLQDAAASGPATAVRLRRAHHPTLAVPCGRAERPAIRPQRPDRAQARRGPGTNVGQRAYRRIARDSDDDMRWRFREELLKALRLPGEGGIRSHDGRRAIQAPGWSARQTSAR